jgi:hypothetical protein
MDKAVTDYINRQKSPQKEICQKLRKIILKTFPRIKEEMKWGVPAYGERYYFVGLKDSVNLGFCIQSLTKKEKDLFKGKGKFMRHIKIKSSKEIIEKEIVKLLKIIKEKK